MSLSNELLLHMHYYLLKSESVLFELRGYPNDRLVN
jgi:hypothetical protein